MDKADIRRCMLEKRCSISDEKSIEKNLAIQQKLLLTPRYKEANVIALYSSFRGEVKTERLIERALFDGKKVVMPKVSMEDYRMHFIAISAKDDLVTNSYGLKEPEQKQTNSGYFAEENIDLFVVPGVAFDLSGNRLGMGKGYYDRALQSVSRDSVVALAYEFQLIDSVPAENHDVVMGTIITEERIIDTLNI
ncbi:MAG: 5-formyltetrahydrofolate cyclo-ligase [Proteobacteria bacterium]|nr:5-formyltetrahydrofolate cyclo-ligase [Pseudomonadota bacterium]